MLIVVLPTLRLLNIHDINSKSQDKNLLRSKVKLNITKTSQTRGVAKFKSRKRSSTSRNWFQNKQNKNLTENSSVFLSNKASFKYQVGYSNYNTYGAKNSDFNVTVAKNTANRIVNIGINLISATTVKVTAPGQKRASLTMTSTFTPTKDMIPTSIHYLIVASKNINDANVSLNMVYDKRTDPMTPITVKIGYFNVKNINEEVGATLLGPIISGIVFWCVLSAIALGTVAIDIIHRNNIYRRICLWFEKRAINEATEGMRLVMLIANDASDLSRIANGETLRLGGKPFVKEGFEEKTDAMILKVDHLQLFDEGIEGDSTDKNYMSKRQENIDIMIDARDRIIEAWEKYRIQGELESKHLITSEENTSESSLQEKKD